MYDLLGRAIGLTKNEVIILEKLYYYGVLTALELSEYTKLGKNTVLFILKNLENKRLVHKRTRNNSFLFQACSPDILLESYNSRVNLLKEQGTELKKLVANLKDVQNYDSLKKLIFYDDSRSIKRLRSGLIDGVQTGRFKRTLPNENGVEVFKNESAVYIINMNKLLAIKIQPAEDFSKIVELFKGIGNEKI
ncbi:MAG TPA: helix-turn-helix domain-containing protein [Candidatus Dojkabacteria bacterium]|nr:helix-turn-helix domain-containing protein [Candidatus Dojkabacteria bacterium]